MPGGENEIEVRNYKKDLKLRWEGDQGNLGQEDYFKLAERYNEGGTSKDEKTKEIEKNLQDSISEDSLKIYTDEAFAQRFDRAKKMLQERNNNNNKDRYDYALAASTRGARRKKHHAGKMETYANYVSKNMVKIRKMNPNEANGQMSNKEAFQLFQIQLDNIRNEYKYHKHYIKLFGQEDEEEKTNQWINKHSSILKKIKLCEIFEKDHKAIAETKAYIKIKTKINQELDDCNKDRQKLFSYRIISGKKSAIDNEYSNLSQVVGKNYGVWRDSKEQFSKYGKLDGQRADKELRKIENNSEKQLYKSWREYDIAMLKKDESMKDYDLDSEINKFKDKMKKLTTTVTKADGTTEDKHMFKYANGFFFSNHEKEYRKGINGWKFHAACKDLVEFLEVVPDIAEDLYKSGIRFKVTDPDCLSNANVQIDNLFGKHFTIYPDADFKEKFEKLSDKTKKFFTAPAKDEDGNVLARKSDTDKYLKDDKGRPIRLTARYGNVGGSQTQYTERLMITSNNTWVVDDRSKEAWEVEGELNPINIETLDQYLNMTDRIKKQILGESVEEQKESVKEDGKLMNYAQAVILNMYRKSDQRFLFDFFLVNDQQTAKDIMDAYEGGWLGKHCIEVPHRENQYVVCIPNEITMLDVTQAQTYYRNKHNENRKFEKYRMHEY